MAQPKDELVRGLGLPGAASMIIGIVIGSGIFLGVNRVAAGTGSPWLVVLVWVLGGFITLMGALTYAELGALFPRAGGEYVFLKEGMGSLAAFLSGWTAFTVNLAGSGAALAVIFAEQLDRLKPDGFVGIDGGLGIKLTAAALILLIATANWFGVRFGGGIQVAFTGLKVTLLIGLAVAALVYAGEPASASVGFFEHVSVPGTPAADGFDTVGFLSLAMVAALFAYDGWTNVVRVGAEIREPSRNIPRAMLLGLGAIMILYILMSLGYLNVLGFAGFANAPEAGFASDRTVGSNAAEVLFGAAGERVVAVLILVSVFGALNGIILSGPRIYYAMSKDRLFPRSFAALNRHKVPHRAIWAQAALSILFLLFFDFNQLTENVVFVSTFFYALTAIGLLVLRRTHPEMPRPYRVVGYPVVPILFILASLAFAGFLLYEQAVAFSVDNLHRFAGLGVVFAGLPFYFVYRRRLVRECKTKGLPSPEPMFGPRR